MKERAGIKNKQGRKLKELEIEKFSRTNDKVKVSKASIGSNQSK